MTSPEVMAEALMKFGLKLNQYDEPREVIYEENGRKLQINGKVPISRLIVERKQFSSNSSSGDLAFIEGEEGYTMICGWYDQISGNIDVDNPASETNKPGLGPKFKERLEAIYAQTSVEYTCRELGMTIENQEVQEDGTVVMTLTRELAEQLS